MFCIIGIGNNVRKQDQVNIYQLIDYCQIDDDNMEQFVQFQWPHIVDISLFDNKFKIKGLTTLLNSQWPCLQSLSLSKNIIGNEGLELVIRKMGRKIKNLEVGLCQISAFGLKPLLENDFRNIKLLWLAVNNIGSVGIKLLVKCSMPNLEHISLSLCKIGSEGLKHLIKSNWAHLTLLNIQQNKIEDSLNAEIFYQNRWPHLQQLYVSLQNSIGSLWLVLLQSTELYVQGQFNQQTTKQMVSKLINGRKLQ